MSWGRLEWRGRERRRRRLLLYFYLMGTGAVADFYIVTAVALFTFYTTSAFFPRTIHYPICPPKSCLES